MGCTPSKSVVVYGQDSAYRDQDTGSTFVSSFTSAVSTPERSSAREFVETTHEDCGRLSFLTVPRDLRLRSVPVSSSCPAGTSSGPSSPSFSSSAQEPQS